MEILFSNQPLSADRNYEVQCQAIGSRPPAKLTWWMGGMELSGLTKVKRKFTVFKVICWKQIKKNLHCVVCSK